MTRPALAHAGYPNLAKLGFEVPDKTARGFQHDFEGAATGGRLRQWGMSDAGPNAAVLDSNVALRARSRQLGRNNPHASSALDNYPDNMVGTGIVPRWNLRAREDEGESVDAMRKIKRHLQERWKWWTEESDADGVLDFYGQQWLTGRSVMESGEMLFRYRRRRLSEGLTVPLQIQLIEPDLLDESRVISSNGNVIIGGKEYDRRGRLVAYWLKGEHPGDGAIRMDSGRVFRIPANQIGHVYRPLRPGQVRGYPWLSSIIVRLWEIDQCQDAMVVRKKIQNLFSAFITAEPDENGDYPLPGVHTLSDEEKADPNFVPVHKMEPGMVNYLLAGEEVKFSNPPQETQGDIDQVRQWLHDVAAGAGVTYEMMTGDLSDVNFASIRAGLNEFRRRCQARTKHILVHQFCRPIKDRWMRIGIAAGTLTVPGFEREMRRFCDVTWSAQAWEYVRPLEDISARKAAARLGLDSPQRMAAARGDDFEEVYDEIADAREYATGRGSAFENDPAQTKASGEVQEPTLSELTGDEPNDDDDEPDDDDDGSDAEVDDRLVDELP